MDEGEAHAVHKPERMYVYLGTWFLFWFIVFVSKTFKCTCNYCFAYNYSNFRVKKKICEFFVWKKYINCDCI